MKMYVDVVQPVVN